MKISDLLKEKRTLSFEVFPPKLDQPLEPLMATLDELEKYAPDFISVTYGAGGTNKGRNNEVCVDILDRKITLMSHFTCIGNTSEDVETRVAKYVGMGAENILALRGDLPQGWTGTRGDYAHANELIEVIAEKFPQLCIGASCYPEKHVEAPDIETDIMYLKDKQDRGAEFFVTQLCFDMDAFDRFMDLKEKKGVTAPVVVGLMPVIGKNGVIRMTSENGCAIPSELAGIIDRYGDDPAEFKKAGLDYTVRLADEYLKRDIAGLHLYTLNRHENVVRIIKDLGLR